MILNFILIILNASINDKPSHKKRTGKIKNTNPPKNMFRDRKNDQFFESKEWDDIPEKRRKLGPLDCRRCGFPLVKNDGTPLTTNTLQKHPNLVRLLKPLNNSSGYKCATRNCGKSKHIINSPFVKKFELKPNNTKFFEKREKRKEAILNGKPLERQKRKGFKHRRVPVVLYSESKEVFFCRFHRFIKKDKKD